MKTRLLKRIIVVSLLVFVTALGMTCQPTKHSARKYYHNSKGKRKHYYRRARQAESPQPDGEAPAEPGPIDPPPKKGKPKHK